MDKLLRYLQQMSYEKHYSCDTTAAEQMGNVQVQAQGIIDE